MLKLNIQYFAETSNDIGIRITLDPSTFNTNLAKLRKQITAFQTNINSIKLDDKFSESLAKVSKVLDNSESQLDLYTKALKEVHRQMSAVEKAHEDGEISTAEYEKQMTSLIVTQESYKKHISNVKKEVEKFKDIQESAALTGKTFDKRLGEIDSSLLKIDKSFNRSVSHLTNWEETTEGLNNKIGSLNKSLTQHNKRLTTLTDEYDRVNLKGKVSKEVKDKLIQEINKEYQAIAKTKSELKKYSKELDDNERKSKELKNTIDGLVKSLEKEVDENGRNSKKAKELRTQISKNATEYNKLQKEIEETKDAQEKTNKGWTIGKQILADMTRSAIYGAINGFKNLTKAVFDSSIGFESAFAGIRKTVDATENELKELEGEILNLSKRVPSTAEELSRVGEIAGQLGIETENIADFVEVITGMSVAFEGVNADEAAMSLAKFANITKMSQTDYEKLGSVITELGNNYAATEGDIIEMATRIAATGEVVGLSEADIMGLSTAISSVGVEAEAGGTAISKLLKQMNTTSQGYASANKMISRTGFSLRELELMASNNSTGFKKLTDSLGLTQKELKNSMTISRKYENFAKTAGVSTEQLSAIMKDDAVKAMAMFIDGLNDTERNGKNAVEILNDMGLTEVRLSNTILALAGSEQELVDVVGTANKAWKDGTALQKEVDKRYATTESRIQMLKNSFTALSITLFSTFKDSFIGAVSSIQSEMEGLNKDLTGNDSLKTKLAEAGKAIGNVVAILFKALRQMLPSLLEFVVELAKLGGRVIPIVVKALVGFLKPLTKVATWLAKNEKVLLGFITALVTYKTIMPLLTKGTKAYTLVSNLFRIATGKATVAQLGLNASMLANPIGLVVAALAGLVVGLIAFSKQGKKATHVSSEITKQTNEELEATNELVEAQEELADARNESIENALLEEERLQDLSNELKLITDENGKVKKGYEERAKVITNELSEALGIEIKATDGIIQNYKDIQKEIDKLIEKKKALAILEAQEDEYNAAQKYFNDDNAKQEYAKAETDYKNAEKLYNQTKTNLERVKEIAKSYARTHVVTDEERAELDAMGYNKGNFTAGGLSKFAKDLESRLSTDDDDDNDTIYENYLKEKETYEKQKAIRDKHLINTVTYQQNLKAIQEGRYEDVTWESLRNILDVTESTQEQIDLVNNKLKTNMTDITDYTKRYKTATGSAKKEIANIILDQLGGLQEARDALKEQYDKSTGQDRVALGKALANIDNQIKAYTNGSEEIKEILAGQVDEYIKTVNKKFAINKELTGEQYRLLWNKIQEETANGTKITQEKLNEWTNSVANLITPDSIEKVKGSTKGLFDAVYNETVIGKDLTAEQYNQLMQKIQQAILDGTPLTLQQIQEMVNGMQKTLTSEDNKTKLEEAGKIDVKQIIKGLLKGTYDENGTNGGAKAGNNILQGLLGTLDVNKPSGMLSKVLSGAVSVGKAIIGSINKGTDSHSPSKAAIKAMDNVFNGLSKGIDKDEDELLNKVQSLGEKLTGTLQDSLGQVRANVAGSVDLGGQVHANGTTNSGTTNNNSKVVNWTQNYTQSKPMSRYDMYIENKRVKNQILQEMNAQS